VLISIISSIFFGIDKITSENPSDSALIHIGLSNRDSSSCEVCSEGGEYYNSGCKRCIQDGIVITTHVAHDKPYRISWSNDAGIYYGDTNCKGTTLFPKAKAFSGDTYWIELIKNDLELQASLYLEPSYTVLYDSISTKMCSNPTNLNFLRLSNEDGKPAGNGGMLEGYVDDFQIWNDILDSNSIPTQEEDFSNCFDKTCGGKWVLQDENMFFVDVSNENFYFNSQVTGSNDYAHYQLKQSLGDQWILRFKFHIDKLEEHPAGKGILKLEPHLRQVLLGIPALFLPIIGYYISRNTMSNLVGSLIVISGVIIFSGIIISFPINEFLSFDLENRLLAFTLALAIGIYLIILGIIKIKQSKHQKIQ
jgi:hypothetical protein